LQLALGVDSLQPEGCPGRLGLRGSSLPLELLGLLDEVQLAPLFSKDEGVLDDGPLCSDQELLDVLVLHLDAKDLSIVDSHAVLGKHGACALATLGGLG